MTDRQDEWGKAAGSETRVGPALLALIGVSGALGATARLELGRAWPAHGGAMPWSTLVINLSGSAVLGVVVMALGDSQFVRVRAVLGTGFLGGYTTFSAFAVETDLLLRRHAWFVAALYVVITMVGGVAAAGPGKSLGRRARPGGAP